MSVNIIENLGFLFQGKVKARTQKEIDKKKSLIIEKLEQLEESLISEGILEQEEKDDK